MKTLIPCCINLRFTHILRKLQLFFILSYLFFENFLLDTKPTNFAKQRIIKLNNFWLSYRKEEECTILIYKGRIKKKKWVEIFKYAIMISLAVEVIQQVQSHNICTLNLNVVCIFSRLCDTFFAFN